MANTIEHGQARAWSVTGSVASVIMRGNQEAWVELRRKLWADDGSEFAKPTTGARAHGHTMEAVTCSMFWDRHPELEIQPCPYVPYRGDIPELLGRVGVSPDRIVRKNGRVYGGLEAKSPTSAEKMSSHLPRRGMLSTCKHYDQIQHSLFVTGYKRWYLAVAAGTEYAEFLITPDKAWLDLYVLRLKAFINFVDGEPVTMRKRRASDIL